MNTTQFKSGDPIRWYPFGAEEPWHGTFGCVSSNGWALISVRGKAAMAQIKDLSFDGDEDQYKSELAEQEASARREDGL
jgi:hypothetical protein